jgi:hypothetical protein
MLYAKIDSNGNLVKYPYMYQDLLEDNPNTNYDDRFDVYGWFVQTDTHLKENFTLVEVKEEPKPEINYVTHYLVLNPNPVNKNGEWVFEYEIVGKSQEQIDAELQYKIEQNHPNIKDDHP